ncbi:hypothetical protein E1B28_001324 [Marasmius oreades]|uniref:Uncharacterized protein n=1 Tax=Marasmius oreades TaxID=181124 RepID=A0A9P8AF18_9AGAR|nr:uncharacterized protein E1B28_001324 [Marasmius oreades]KAG7099476.1 hypothetical protein E1B28_001324 [Marasmius oreades]
MPPLYRSEPSYPHPNSSPQYNHDDEDFKPPFDDLIGEYSQPYATHPRHQTYTVQPMNFGSDEHQPAPSQPLASKPPLFTKNTSASSQDLNTVGYPPASWPKPADNRSFWRRILPESMACRLYLLTVLIETTIDLAIEGELIVRVREGGGDEKRMPVYLGIFVLAHVFQFAMAVDAVRERNTLQFISLAIFNALFLVYAIIQISEVREAVIAKQGITNIPINVLTTIIPIVIAVSELAYIALGWKIYDEFGWKVYKFLGADRRIKRMYANYQIYECLVKFDVFFWVGFSVQFIWLVLNRDDWEFYVTCAALPLSVILLAEGHLAARYEHKWMMATFLSGCVGAMIYFLYKLIKVLMFKDQPQFLPIWKTLTVFSVIAILLLFATFIFSVLVMRKFGRGLKTALARKKEHQRFDSRPMNGLPASMNPNRMSID